MCVSVIDKKKKRKREREYPSCGHRALHVCTGNILCHNLAQSRGRRNDTALHSLGGNGVAVARLMEAHIYVCVCYHGKNLFQRGP